MTFISLHAATRDETRRQTAVADALRNPGHRYHAAIELEQAAEQVRLADYTGTLTDTQRARLTTAQDAWDAYRTTDGRRSR